MEKTNTNNYNTPYSKVYNFKNFNADTEIKDLGKTKRSFVKNYDDVYELPNNKKMYFNKVTKNMQSLSKDEIDDKIEAAEEYKEDEKSNEEKSPYSFAIFIPHSNILALLVHYFLLYIQYYIPQIFLKNLRLNLNYLNSYSLLLLCLQVEG